MNNRIRLERLNELKFLMDNHSKFFKKENIKFDINNWFNGELESGCGTAACALGSAALYPPFKKKGLKLKGGGDFWEVCYNKYSDFKAGSKFFGITHEESEALFSPYSYRQVGIWEAKPKDVSKRISILIKQYSK